MGECGEVEEEEEGEMERGDEGVRMLGGATLGGLRGGLTKSAIVK